MTMRSRAIQQHAVTTDRRSLVKGTIAAVTAGSILASSTAASINAQERQRFTYAFKSDIQTLDPMLTTDTTTQNVYHQIFEMLVQMGRDGQFEPVLAESWESVDDTTWRFKLREGVTFHNGEPFNADCVTFSLDRLRSEELASPAAPGAAPIDTIEKVDEFTVEVVTTAPYAALLSTLYGSLPILPPAYLDEVGDEGFAAAPVGTGPFKFVEWVKDVEVRMEANSDHWRGAPAISELIFRPIPEDSARIAALQNEEVDWIAAVHVDRVAEFEGSDQITIASRPGQGVYAQMDCLDTEPFQNVEVRQAVNHAVNVDSIVEDLFGGQATRLPSAFFVATPGYDENMEPYAYDPELASQKLADAGYPEGFEVTFNVSPGVQATQKLDEVGQAIAQDLSQVGILANIEIVDPAVHFERYHAAEYSFFLLPWGSAHESGRHIHTLLHSETRGYYYQNPEADELIDAFMQEVDPELRVEAGSRLNEFLQQDAPWLYLYQEPDIYGYLSWVNWEPNQYDIYFHAYEVTLD
jgi:peptide/nickel transport system substrate-binding protein